MGSLQSAEAGSKGKAGLSDNRSSFIIKIAILCVVSVLGNELLSYLITGVAKAPLYLDTVFTVAICFAAGLVPGLLTGVVFSILISPFIYIYLYHHPVEMIFASKIFSICVVVELLLVYFFHKKIRSREAVFLDKPSLSSFIGLAPLLLILVAIDCIAVSFSGGVIDFMLTRASAVRPYFPEDSFKLGLFRNNVPVLTAAILSRIPINIVDRSIVIFGGFGISLAYRKLLR